MLWQKKKNTRWEIYKHLGRERETTFCLSMQIHSLRLCFRMKIFVTVGRLFMNGIFVSVQNNQNKSPTEKAKGRRRKKTAFRRRGDRKQRVTFREEKGTSTH